MTRASDNPGQPDGSGDPAGTAPGSDPSAEAFAEAKAHVTAVGEAAKALGEHAATYLQARRDLVLVYVRKLLLGSALLTIVLFALATFLATAVVLACVGLALAVSALFGSLWAGVLVTGFGLLLVTAAVLGLGVKLLTNAKRRATFARYGATQPAAKPATGPINAGNHGNAAHAARAQPAS